MRLYLEGDASAFHELYRRYSKKVFGYFVRRTTSKEEAQDLGQAVFMKFHQTRDQFDFNHSVAQYLFVIARSALIDQQRKNVRKDKGLSEFHESNEIATDEPIADSERTVNWSGLGSDQKTALKMRYIDEASYAEIARKLNRSEQGVRQLVSRALKQLKSLAIGKSGPDRLKGGSR